MKSTNIFCEENIGIPIKWNQGCLFWYGRYYGMGYDGESGIKDKDADIGLLVTPDNRSVAVALCNLEYKLTEEDLLKLSELEKVEEKPYKQFFDIKNNRYIKNFEYRKFPLMLGKYCREWYEDHGLYNVETDVLGNAIAKLFSIVYGKEYFYQKVVAHCEDTNQCDWRREEANRCMRIISSTKYDDKIYSSATYHGVFIPPIYFDCISCKDYTRDNLFKHVPVKVNDGDFLLYFSNQWDPNTIRIGDMKNASGESWSSAYYFDEYKFTPKNFNCKCVDDEEVQFDNSRFISLSDFLKKIFYYKLQHYKLELDDEDMEIIIKDFLDEVEKEPEKYIETNATISRNTKFKPLVRTIEKTTTEK